jgi:hypothetical protein
MKSGGCFLKVASPAGDFEILIKNADVEGDFIILKGQMGVWDSKIYLSPSDLWFFTSILLRPSILVFLLRLPFRLIFKRSQSNKTE